MSFVDKVQVLVKAGNGGNGCLSFRHEKFVEKGGPDGGNGGNGGNVILVASRNEDTLASFRYHKKLVAESGQAGSKRKKHGKSADDLLVTVPIGTLATTADGTVVADLIDDGQRATIGRGGRGGYGNAHFVSSTRQAPRIAEKGEPGEELTLTFELKMIADVGVIGLPNAGKSTLLSVLSNAKPHIANYPFTTLVPNLGVVDLGQDRTLLFADIPGLIEGAAEGKGLGDEFLRHIERTLVLVHLIDVYSQDIAKDYQIVQAELQAYAVDLSKRPQIIALTKIEGLDQKTINEQTTRLKKIVPADTPILAISAQAHQALPELLSAITRIVDRQHKKQAAKAKRSKEKLPILRLPESVDSWRVEKVEDGFRVSGPKIERFAARLDTSAPESEKRLRDIMQKMGIIHELIRRGVEPGQKIHIRTYTLEY